MLFEIKINSLMEACLPKDEEGNIIADQEKSDVVHDLLAFLAERMLEMNKLLPLMERIRQTDELIDQVVYRLYGLTEDEIAIVKGGKNSKANRQVSKPARR